MKIGLYLFEQFHGRKGLGSSKIRGHWLAEKWDDAEIFIMGKKYDTIIYQKVYHIDHAKLFKGLKILDLCDPDWLHWAYRTKEMIEEIDIITTSSENLKTAIEQMTDKPVFCIPDRINLESIENIKVHEGDAKSAVWFGYSDNFEVLDSVIPALKKYKLDLIVVSDGMYSVPSAFSSVNVTNYKWDENAHNNIINGDIALNPQKTKGKWKFKSNNKTLLAWSLGLPVATNSEELELYINENERKNEIKKRSIELVEKWDIKYSVEELKSIIDKYKK